jgi:hypothetical protein
VPLPLPSATKHHGISSAINHRGQKATGWLEEEKKMKKKNRAREKMR